MHTTLRFAASPTLVFSFGLFVAVAACGGAGESGGLLGDAGAGEERDAGRAEDAARTRSPSDADAGTRSPVSISNLSYTRAKFGEVTLNFVLENTSDQAVESLERIAIEFAGDKDPTEFNVDFAEAGFESKTCTAWMIAAGGKSTVIEIVLRPSAMSNSSDTFFWVADIPCDKVGDKTLTYVFPNKIVPSNPEGTASLRLSGLLADAASWSAVASGSRRE